MGNGAGKLCPEFFPETRDGEDRTNSFADRPVGSFCNTLLFWCIRRCHFVVDPCFATQLRHLFLIFAAAIHSNRLDAASALLEYISESEEALPYFLCHLCFEYKQIHHSRGVIDKREEVSRLAERDGIDAPAYVTVD